MQPINKLTRITAEKRIRAKRAKTCGWKAAFVALPMVTQVAFANTGDIRISKRLDRKQFGKTTGKRYYGHFSGRSRKAISKRDLVERATIKNEIK